MQLKEKLNYGEFKELYGKQHLIPTGFRYYIDSILTYHEWMDLMDIYIELEETERSN